MGDEAVIEFEKVMSRLGGDKELFHELVAIFTESHVETMRLLQSAVEQKVARDVSAQAHSIKGALGNIGAARAHAVALALELAGRSDDSTNFSVLLKKLEQEISAYFAEYKSRQWD